MKKSQKEPVKTSKAPQASPWEKLHSKIMALMAGKPNDHLESITEKRAADAIVELAAEYVDGKQKEIAGLETEKNVAKTKRLLHHAMSFASKRPMSEKLPRNWAALFKDIVDKADREASR